MFTERTVYILNHNRSSLIRFIRAGKGLEGKGLDPLKFFVLTVWIENYPEFSDGGE
jgi:hypothetical protein